MIGKEQPATPFEGKRLAFIQAFVEIMVVLAAYYKKIGAARRYGGKTAQVKLPVATYIVVGTGGLRRIAVGLVVDIGKQVAGVVKANSEKAGVR